MPLKSGWTHTLFNKRWQDELHTATQKAYVAKVEIFSVDVSDAVFDPDTGEYTYPNDKVVHYSGPARVQPIRSANKVNSGAYDTRTQAVLFSISDLSLDLKLDWQVRVTECELNPVLTRYKYVIEELMDSQNLVERTFITKVDQEVVVDQ